MADRPRLVDGIQVHRMEDGFVILSEAQDRVHYLNATATLVMMLCDGVNTPDDIAGLLQHEFGLDAPPVRDVAGLLVQLRDEGLLAHQAELVTNPVPA
jgi:hypothetical protein